LAAHKIDIFQTLKAIDERDMDFFANLSEEERKGFAPPVVLRWASAVDGKAAEHYIWLVNDRANINFHDIWEHPELQYKLLASCGAGGRQSHKWLSMTTAKKKKADTVRFFISSFWPDANDNEVEILLNQFTEESFEDFAFSSGRTPDEIQEVLESYGRLIGKAYKSKSKKSKSRGKAT
jgi:hypothetical protein